jgi:hypothetical protein
MSSGLRLKESHRIRWIQLGALKMHKIRLQDNFLHLVTDTKSPRIIMNNVQITDKMRLIIKTLMLEGEINYKLLQDLEKSEKRLFEKIMKLTLLHNELDFDKSKMDYSYEDIKSKFEIEKGELEAGNDSKYLRKKFKRTITLMLNADLIEEDVAQGILEELDS